MTSVTSPTSTPATTTNQAAASTTPDPAAALSGDFNTFLTLLTTQLQNQDPTAPLDTNQLTQQLVSFSQVEQAINTNTKLANLISLQSADQTVTALPLVGHTVEFTDNQLPLVSGKADFSYTLPSQAAQATITITDPSGQIVYQGAGQTTAGVNRFTWDGTGSDGSQLPDGVYTFNVSALAADGSSLTATDSAFGTVDSISMQNGATTVNMGGLSEPLSKIISITS